MEGVINAATTRAVVAGTIRVRQKRAMWGNSIGDRRRARCVAGYQRVDATVRQVRVNGRRGLCQRFRLWNSRHLQCSAVSSGVAPSRR